MHQLELCEGMIIQDVPNGEEPVIFFGEILVQGRFIMMQFVCFLVSAGLKVAYVLVTGLEVIKRLLFFSCVSRLHHKEWSEVQMSRSIL